MFFHKKFWSPVGLLVVAAIVLAACQPQTVEVEVPVEVEVTREVEVEVPGPEVEVEVVVTATPEPVSDVSVLRIVAEEDWAGAESIDPASASRDLPSIRLLYSQMIRLDKENHLTVEKPY